MNVVANLFWANESMPSKLLYTVAEEVGFRTKTLSGELELLDDRLSITGPNELSLRYEDVECLRIYRHGSVGTLIHVRCVGTSVFLTVPRIHLLGVVAVINRFETDALFVELQQKITDSVDPGSWTLLDQRQATAFLTPRRVIVAHLATVSYITVLFFATGDLHAVQSVLLAFLVPAIYSIFCFPPVVLYTVWRHPQGACLALAAELVLACMHVVVVSAGIASY